MSEPDDLALLREYATQNSESAFAELVSRRVDFVYSAALRQTQNPHLAEEITQAVFILLAQKAGKISDKTILTGWLFKTTRFTALAQIRAETKRARQQKEFQMQNEIQPVTTDEFWNQMSPLLDEALAALGETDRQAVLLRFFENKSLAEVGQFLGIGEDTARKRISRALEKLHRHFNKRGVSSTTAIIAGAISTNSIHAAPVGLAKTISAVAITKGATASTSTLTLIKGALKIMAWSKAKTAIVTGAVILLAAGTTTVTVKEIQKYKLYNAWRVRFYNPQLLEQAPPQVRILPSKFPPGGIGSVDGAWMGIGQSIDTIIYDAYLHPAWRTKILAKLPVGHFDFIAKLPNSSKLQDALQNEIKKKFGLVSHLEMQSADALLLTVKNLNANGLKIHNPQIARSYYSTENLGKISFVNRPFHELSEYLESDFQIPIVDGTGIESNVDVTLTWNRKDWEHPNLDGLKQALLDQLGLELVPTNMPIEMLVVEKAK
jgi:uncharacterized protein (TIGR03435 family)